MAGCGMEVDSHHPTSASAAPYGGDQLATPASSSTTATGLNPLKRSNSAPTINVLVSSTSDLTMVCSSSVDVTSHNCQSFTSVSVQPVASSFGIPPEPRARRFSCSGMMLHSPTTPVKNRLVQIKHEESLSQGQREVAHEREVQMTQQIYRSWENLAVDESVAMVTEPAMRPKSLGEPLHIQTSLGGYVSSPSPTRALGRQCFSPSLQQTVRTSVLSPSPSPSPTRKSFRSGSHGRSVSPITLRPSPLGCLGTKRKMDSDWSDRPESYPSPAKRFHYSPLVSSPVTPDRATANVSPFPLPCSSSSSSSMNSELSEPQRVPSFSTPLASVTSGCFSSSTFHAPISSNSTPSPCYMFRTVRDSIESSHGTDSETSDMTETTDISEHAETSFGMGEGNSRSPEGGAAVSAVSSRVTSLSQSECRMQHSGRNYSESDLCSKTVGPSPCNQATVARQLQNSSVTFNCQLEYPPSNLTVDVGGSTNSITGSSLQSVPSTSQTVGQ